MTWGSWVDHGNHSKIMAIMVQKSLSKRVVVCCFGFVEVRIFGDMNAEWRAFVYVSGYSLVCQKRVIERIVSAWFYRQYGDAPEVSDNRMRERMSMKSKMLGALALLTLIGALFVMQSAEQYTPTVDAATGTIDALNVGTCLTTNDDVFKGDCKILMNDESGTANDWEVRAKKTEVKTLYATYAHDPKTASDEPRAILTDSDLLEISISDPGRDRRTGVLIRGAHNASALTTGSGATLAQTPLGTAIKKDLGDQPRLPERCLRQRYFRIRRCN